MTNEAIKQPGRSRPLAYDEKGRYAGYLVHQFEWTLAGNLTTGDKPFRFYNCFGIPLRILCVALSVGTNPTGAAVIVDIHKNGTTIFTTQAHRPQIAAAANYGASNIIDVFNWMPGEFLIISVDQVGSFLAGANLTVQLLAQ